MEGKKYIVVSGNSPIPLSKVTVDCDLNLCVSTRKGETLKTVLGRLCEKITTAIVSPKIHWDDVTNKPDFSISVYNKDLIGPKNGINRVFKVDTPYRQDTTRVYVNGVRMKLNWDYFETDNLTITFDFDISERDQLIIDYNI